MTLIALLTTLTVLGWIGAILMAPFLFVWVCFRYLGSRSVISEVQIMNKSESSEDRPHGT